MYGHIRRSGIFWGIILIVIGIFIWLGNLGVFDFSWGRDWPIILIIIGICQFVKIIPSKRPRKSKIKVILKKIEDGEMSAEEGIEKIEK